MTAKAGYKRVGVAMIVHAALTWQMQVHAEEHTLMCVNGTALTPSAQHGASDSVGGQVKLWHEEEDVASGNKYRGVLTSGWTMLVDNTGCHAFPALEDTAWSLRVAAWGYAPSMQSCSAAGTHASSPDTIERAISPNVIEWFRGCTMGIEHGLTLSEAPELERSGPLVVLIDTAPGWLTENDTNGRGVTFHSTSHNWQMRYRDLHVYDSTGCELVAWMEAFGSFLQISILDECAVYPVIVDPLIQPVRLIASNPVGYFGTSVSASGDLLVCGAPVESSDCMGVNCDPQLAGSAAGSGAAYAFSRTASGWSQVAYLKASNTDPQDRFGTSVAVNGDTIVVGAPYESSSSSGINGGQFDNSLFHSGAAYVFVRSGLVWVQQAYLKASNPDANDEFGCSVAVCGDTIAVGARGESSAASIVNGNQLDNSKGGAGAVYVFVRSAGTWSQQAYLKANNPDSSDEFGYSLAIDGTTIIVGAPGEDSAVTGSNGNGLDNGAPGSGAAYTFLQTGVVWSQSSYLKASNTGSGDAFGSSVAISGPLILIGAPGESSSATGVNGNEADESAPRSGAAFAFTRISGAWAQSAYLKASNTDAFDEFGHSVAVSRGRLAVAAWFEASNTSGVDGNQNSNSAPNAGAAYAFTWIGQAPSQGHYLKATQAFANAKFGSALGMSSDTLVVGANNDGTPVGFGSAFVFQLDTTGVPFCSGDGSGSQCPCSNNGSSGRGCGNSSHIAGGQLSSLGSARLSADSLQLLIDYVPSGSGLLYQGLQQVGSGAGAAFGDGLRCIGGAIQRLAVLDTAGGSARYPAVLTSSNRLSVLGSALPGQTISYQIWYRDSASYCTPATFNLSNGLAITWLQ